MKVFNMRFHLRFADTRPISEILSALGDMFGGAFVIDEKAKGDGTVRYVNYVFGLNIGLLQFEDWGSEKVYLLSGVASEVRHKTSDEVDMCFHVKRMLEQGGCQRVMTVDEFVAESQRRGLR